MSEPARDATGGHEHVQRGVVGAVGAIGLATLTSRVLGETDMRVFNSDAAINLDGDEQVA